MGEQLETSDETTRVQDGDQDRIHQIARMDRDLREHNEAVRQRCECETCGRDVPTHDFPTKYAAAGGVLTGPFCSAACYWRWINQ